MTKDNDYTGTHSAANRLANKIQRFWRIRGYPTVAVWVEPIPEFPGNWQIRSNIKFQNMK